MKYLIILYALCFPSLLGAAINECSIQQDHCNISEALFRIDKLERSLFQYGPFPWTTQTPVGGKHYQGDSN